MNNCTRRRYIVDKDGVPCGELMEQLSGEIRFWGRPGSLFELGTILHPVPDVRGPQKGETIPIFWTPIPVEQLS